MNTKENGTKNDTAQKIIFVGALIGTNKANGMSMTREGIKKIISLRPTFGIISNFEFTFLGITKSFLSNSSPP